MLTENDSSTSSVQLGEASDINQAVRHPVADQFFVLFADCMQNQVEMKRKEIEEKSRIDKEVAG